MGTITNKTRRPLSVPLPEGRTLRLGPLAVADISAKAERSAAVKKLVEAGTVEIQHGTSRQVQSGSRGGAPAGGRRGASGGPGIRKSGDR